MKRGHIAIIVLLLGVFFVVLVPPPPEYEEIGDIQSIEISYNVTYFAGQNEKHYSIENRNGRYYTEKGEIIDVELVRGFVESFTDLYETDKYESGYEDFSMTDFYPEFTIVITHARGKTVVKSSSNFYCFIPWNVEHNGHGYVQYNGKIPAALFNLLIRLDDYWLSFEHEAQWGCHPVRPPERYAEKGISPSFPKSVVVKTPEEVEGASHILWDVNVGSDIVCPPSYVDGKIFVATSEKLLCLDSRGKKIWEAAMDGRIPSFFTGSKTHITFKDGRIYVTLLNGVVSLDAETGEKIWQFTGRSLFGDPLYHDERIFLRLQEEEDGYIALVCLNARTGEKTWEFTGKEPQVNYDHLIHYDAGRIYVVTGEPSLYCLDATSGDTLWVHQRDSPCNVLEIHEDYLLAGPYTSSGTMECLEKGTGAVVWNMQNTGLAAVYGERILLERFEEDGIYEYLADVSSGTILWVGQIFGGDYERFYENGVLYYRTSGGKAVAGLDVVTAEELFRYTFEGDAEIVDVNDHGVLVQVLSAEGEKCYSFVDTLLFLDKKGGIVWEHEYADKDTKCGDISAGTFGDTLVVFRGFGFVEAFDIKTGDMRWETEMGGSGTGEFEVLGNIYLPASDGILYCLEAGSGHVLWVVDSKSAVTSSEGREALHIFATGSGVLYFYTEDGWVWAVSVE